MKVRSNANPSGVYDIMGKNVVVKLARPGLEKGRQPSHAVYLDNNRIGLMYRESPLYSSAVLSGLFPADDDVSSLEEGLAHLLEDMGVITLA